MKNKKNTIVICEGGWILIGEKEITNIGIKLKNSFIVRCWRNQKGIGGLAKKENKNEYILDEVGTATIYSSKILFEIPCEW